MFGWDDAQNDYDRTQDDNENQASFGHELIAGGAAFAGMKAFEDHQRRDGKPVSHQFAKELVAGFAGAEVDRLAETKGADAWDRHEAKQRAEEKAQDLYDQHYVDRHGADQYDPDRYGRHEHLDRYGGGGGGYGGGGDGYGGGGDGYGGGGDGYGRRDDRY